MISDSKYVQMGPDGHLHHFDNVMLSLCEHRFSLFNFILQELGLASASGPLRVEWRQRPQPTQPRDKKPHLGCETAELLLHVVQDLDLQVSGTSGTMKL